MRSRAWFAVLGGVAASLVLTVSPVVAKSSQTYSDAAAYCRAVGTVDMPSKDTRWRGTKQPDWIVRALGGTDYPWLTSWRCMNGVVLGCNAANANTEICSKAETSRIPPRKTRAYCREHPNTSVPMSAQSSGLHEYSSWSCAGTKPYIDGPGIPLDRRGYGLNWWKPVSPEKE